MGSDAEAPSDRGMIDLGRHGIALRGNTRITDPVNASSLDNNIVLSVPDALGTHPGPSHAAHGGGKR
eukprot:15432390-Alexandrium_andersonii.AAC.2